MVNSQNPLKAYRKSYARLIVNFLLFLYQHNPVASAYEENVPIIRHFIVWILYQNFIRWGIAEVSLPKWKLIIKGSFIYGKKIRQNMALMTQMAFDMSRLRSCPFVIGYEWKEITSHEPIFFFINFYWKHNMFIS